MAFKGIQSVLFETHDPFDLTDNKGNPIPVAAVNNPDFLDPECLLLFHGGEDIHPSLYGKKAHKYNDADYAISGRDKLEQIFFKKAKELNMAMVGICRGAQLICALDGGHLWQHIENHKHREHLLFDKTKVGHTFYANSYHHQAMVPKQQGTQVLAVTKGTYKVHGEPGECHNVNEINEIVYFPDSRALGIQGHPEWTKTASEFNQYCRDKIIKLLM